MSSELSQAKDSQDPLTYRPVFISNVTYGSWGGGTVTCTHCGRESWQLFGLMGGEFMGCGVCFDNYCESKHGPGARAQAEERQRDVYRRLLGVDMGAVLADAAEAAGLARPEGAS